MADTKYGRIIVEGKNIPEEEPLFLLRGQDWLAPWAVRAYVLLLRLFGLRKAADQCEAVAVAMEAWPYRKMPD